MTPQHECQRLAKTFMAFVLSVGMLFALIPSSAFAATSSERISKDKSATWDVAGDTATVKLNIPNPEQTQLDSDVVFVLDKSSCGTDTADAATKLANSLVGSVSKSGAKVKVGVVAFDGDVGVDRQREPGGGEVVAEHGDADDVALADDRLVVGGA